MTAGRADLPMRAPRGKLQHPPGERRAEPWLHPERGAGIEERLQRQLHRPRLGERRNMARADIATVAVGTLTTDAALIDDRDVEAGCAEIVAAGEPYNPTTRHDHRSCRTAHRPIPSRNGSPGWRIKKPSAVTKASPVIVGITFPSPTG